MTAIVAVVLAGLSTSLKDIHDRNEAIYNKKSILASVANHLDMDFSKISNEEVLQIFDTQIEQIVTDTDGNVLSEEQVMDAGYTSGKAEDLDLKNENKKLPQDKLLPVFLFTKADGNKYPIVYTRGKGLWDEIWGCIALESDYNTIAGVSFDHKAETPGLGAEIKDNKSFPKSFIGKKIYNEGDLTSVKVRKGDAKDPIYEVDGISGATITADGVTEMLSRCLNEYDSYFKAVKK